MRLIDADRLKTVIDINMLNTKNDRLIIENSEYRASLKAISKITKNTYIKALCEE